MIDYSFLKEFRDPFHQKTASSLKISFDVEETSQHFHIRCTLPYPLLKSQEIFTTALTTFCQEQGIDQTIQISLQSKIFSHRTQPNLNRHPQIKNIIAVGSGKGGVGKSTVAVNLALALQQEGAQVGLLDADIYGPSQPLLLGGSEAPESLDKKSLEPVERYGLQTMSIGYLIDTNTAMIWRGPMVSTALQQLLNDTRWKNLDYLIVDLPPGTGDIQLTLAQKIPVSGALVVTTPQDLALADARRAIKMFEKVHIPVLGLIENMSYFNCPDCGHTSHLFGKAGASNLSQETALPILGHLPLSMEYEAATESHLPLLIHAPNSQNAQEYRALAIQVATQLSQRPRNYNVQLPKVVIEKP